MAADRLVREAILKLKPYSPGKPIEEVEREYGLRDIIKLASNENPLGPSPRAIAAMEAAIRQVRLYPDNDWYDLRRALARHLGFPAEQIVVGHGSDELIHNIGLAFINPGEEVMMPEGPFSQYEFTGQLMAGELVKVAYTADFRYDLEAMGERLSEKTKVVYLGNPNNPTGTIVTKREVDRFLERLPARAVLVLDEAYSEYVEDPEYPRSLEYVREGRRVVVLRTFSKIYALAGLRIGYGVSTPEVIGYLQQVREPFNVSNVALAAAGASLEDGDQVRRSRELNREGKQYFYREFERLGLRYARSEANFVWVDVGRDGGEVYEALLKRGVIVRGGDIFGFPNHLRVTTGTREQNERFIAELEGAVAGSARGEESGR
jgi:histidinol-phosphate aminotransferase